ncbi:response regulator [Oceanotoga sp. DSM 15011]|jgi:CheY-like chemotaxis protein|uniref:Two-component system response regulator n=1 Tax=Oceanotoga teriensis TaxID=515440 RepID=A0AA45HJ70_9BACT|nr:MULTISPECIES: response regulator [Oceanotoga]MDN5343003.1 hypothetical protein [Oceanotoga sp.]MDO7977108.1 response regulator [Oceanotoga teriensis]PWJ95606.1 two-component system response regulator [Oceanotoga teriensis]UYO99440.1 response regulator [Oceanotoga sp. DSM 15011]
MKIKPLIVVEDYDIDYEIIKETIEESGINNPLIRFKNGLEIMNYLKDENFEKPVAILLDLYMPEMDGFEFLKSAKEEKLLKNIKIIVLTAKNTDKTRIESYKLGVNGYLEKPFDVFDFLQIIRSNNYN